MTITAYSSLIIIRNGDHPGTEQRKGMINEKGATMHGHFQSHCDRTHYSLDMGQGRQPVSPDYLCYVSD